MTNRREILWAAGAAGILAGGAAGEPNASRQSPLDSEKFRQAVLSGDLPTVTSMLDRDPALRYSRDAAGVSIFTLACLKGQPKIAEKIAEEIAGHSFVPDIFEAAASGDSKRANEIAKDDPGL